ncbi:MAG TPA: TAXI family TRAP transporter solute-binding subunit [Rhizomicrobium sp.]|nr:TAXI family TRAP transporter solute-binding subunit [Rhizomicrobium sp.]
MDRLVRTGFVFAGLVLAAAAGAQPARQSFDVVTGPASGGYFAAGELIAQTISHPPGLVRCETKGVCAPAGVIVSARSSDGAVSNILAVNLGSAASGLAQAPVVADAVAGRGVFRRDGPQRHLRVMADLFGEPLALVARPGIAGVRDLRGKRVSLGEAGCAAVAAEVLSAYGVRGAKLRREPAKAAAAELRTGQLDALFVLGDPAVTGDLVARGAARLVAIDGRPRDRLVERFPGVAADLVSAGRGTVETIGVRTLWITADTASNDVVYGLVRALYSPANRETLAQAPRPAPDVRVIAAASLARLPLHPGAAQFYREAGLLKQAAGN